MVQRPEPTPIFILSLPRTGSTLLQRILGSHEAIATASEPWLMLPILYSLRYTGIAAEYQHQVAARGIRGFAESYLPRGITSYRDAVRDFALRLYAEAADGRPYFLDKTPRYHFIADDLIELFPTARFIFLWRHPLAVAGSMMEAWTGGKWNLDSFSRDLFYGVPALIDSYRAHADSVASVRYEDLVAHPADSVGNLLNYLQLPADPSVLTRFTEMETRNPEFWDPVGTRRYRTISADPMDKWRSTMANPIRKNWCRRYVRWLGPDRLDAMGYDIDQVLDELRSIKSTTRFMTTDVPRIAVGAGERWLRGQVLEQSFPLWSAHRRSSTREDTRSP